MATKTETIESMAIDKLNRHGEVKISKSVGMNAGWARDLAKRLNATCAYSRADGIFHFTRV